MSTTVNQIDTQELDALLKDPENEKLRPVLEYIYEILRQLRAESDLDS